MYFHVTGTLPDRKWLAPFVEDEIRVSEELKAQGTTLMVVRRVDRPGVFLIMQAESQEAVQEALGRLPFVAEGLMTLDIVEVTRL
ncbi:muconolactone Delta-isomerase family protein [Streptomyces sp. NPDC093228]|uniref:muconolactone Delta-isomerase family protein n=1 Tax=Streptomyces sp. NPDC093228 TaxID=3155070 RepID=UPI00342E360D